MTREPLISIVTPCLNRREFVAEAIESVAAQDYSSIEHIVIDGISTDGTLEVLSNFPHLRLISEADEGVYEAINKGIKVAKGEIVGLLNTDDVYEASALPELAEELNRHPEWDAIAGAADIFERDSHGRKTVLRTFSSVQESDIMRRIALSAPIINAWLFRKRAFERNGFFDRSYRIAGDSDFLIRARLAGLSFGSLNKMIYHYRSHTGSLTISLDTNRWLSAASEIIRISEKYLSRRHPRDVWFYCRIWHMHAQLFVLQSELRRGRLSSAIRVIIRSFRTDPLWPSLYIRSRLFGIPESQQVLTSGNA